MHRQRARLKLKKKKRIIKNDPLVTVHVRDSNLNTLMEKNDNKDSLPA